MSYVEPTTIHAASATGDGPIFRVGAMPVMFSGYLSGSGGSATVDIYLRETASAPWYLRGTLTLSGANGRDQFSITGESWYQGKATISAISAATATIVMGG